MEYLDGEARMPSRWDRLLRLRLPLLKGDCVVVLCCVECVVGILGFVIEF